MTNGAARVARGALVGTLTVALGAVAHVAAGGVLPGYRTGIPLTVAVLVAAVFLSSRRWRPQRLLPLFVAAQGVIHTSAMAAQSAAVTHDHGGHHHGAASMSDPSAGLGGSVDAGTLFTSWIGDTVGHIASEPLMVVAHVIAAVVLVAYVEHGERALAGLYDRLALRWAVVVAPLLPQATAVSPVPSVRMLRATLLLSALRGRAPPVAVR